MGGEWKRARLADLCDSIDYGYTQSASSSPVGPRFLRITDIVGGGINWLQVPYCEADEAACRQYRLYHGDIVIARTGATTGASSYISTPPPAVFASYLVRLRVKSSVSARFVAYILKSDFFWQYIRGVLGDKSAQPNASAKTMTQVEVPVPPLPIQHAIADILGSLDDKIELNRRTNETLEAMAKALFKSWFVDFDPVVAKSEGRQPDGMDAETAKLFPSSFVDSDIGRVPKGWRVGTVSDLVSLSRTALSPNQFPDEVFYHYSLPAFDEGRLPKAESGGTIMSNKFIVPDVCVLLSKLNPRISRVWMPVTDGQRRALCSTEFLVCLPQVGISREFLFLLFTSTEFCERFTTFVTGTSGSHQRVKPESLLSTEIVIPPEGLIEAFTSVTRPLLTAITANIEQSRELANIRDALLPRLLSGELAIPPSKIA